MKTMQFLKLPDVLVLHLKRFEWRNAFFGGKITSLVDFPLNGLDMGPYMVGGGGDHVFDLVGVSNHYGNMGGGHYTAVARDIRERDRWIEFDDSRFQAVDPGEVVSEAAYLLFYQRRS